MKIKHNYKIFKEICLWSPEQIAKKYGLKEKESSHGKYWHLNNRSNVLGIAHTDSVSNLKHFRIINLPDETIIYNTSLDDRAGVYVLLYVLPQLGINVDVLLTEGEEVGRSTGEEYAYDVMTEHNYNWMFQFDRGYDEVALYQYEDNTNWKRIIKEIWGKVDYGLFSDISFMDCMGICGLNIPTGYRDYHMSSAHIYMSVLNYNLGRFKKFYDTYKNIKFHYEDKYTYKRSYGYVKYKDKKVTILYNCCLCNDAVLLEDFYGLTNGELNYCQDNELCQDCYESYYTKDYEQHYKEWYEYDEEEKSEDKFDWPAYGT